MNIIPDPIPLSELPRELAKLTNRPAPAYRLLYTRALNNTLKVEKIGARWFAQRADLRQIAVQLGLAEPLPDAPRRRRRPTEQQTKAAA
jgi:hypothetical protein